MTDIKYSIHKAADNAFLLNFENLTTVETVEFLMMLRRHQRTREGTVTSPAKMTDFLNSVEPGFSNCGPT